MDPPMVANVGVFQVAKVPMYGYVYTLPLGKDHAGKSLYRERGWYCLCNFHSTELSFNCGLDCFVTVEKFVIKPTANFIVV